MVIPRVFHHHFRVPVALLRRSAYPVTELWVERPFAIKEVFHSTDAANRALDTVILSHT